MQLDWRTITYVHSDIILTAYICTFASLTTAGEIILRIIRIKYSISVLLQCDSAPQILTRTQLKPKLPTSQQLKQYR